MAVDITSKEKVVLRALIDPQHPTTKEIASSLNLSKKTVDVHRTNLMRKLDVHSRKELVFFVQKNPEILDGSETKKLKENPMARLTPRENDVLNILLLGKRNKDIGQILNISPHTVRTHITNILVKTGYSGRVKLAVNIQKIKE